MAYLSRLRECFATDCPLCECPAQGGDLCSTCQEAVLRSMRTAARRCAVCMLALDESGGCPLCTAQFPAFERIIAAFDYAEPGDFLVHRLKSGRRFVLAPMLARMLAQAVRQAPQPLPGNTILVPVPASRAAIMERGFNPAAEIARYLSRELGLACRPELLRRAREGRRQAGLLRTERMRNAHSLYDCPQRVDGLRIAVVDDVLTTGSTLHSIAGMFKCAGAASVCGLVLARTPRS